MFKFFFCTFLFSTLAVQSSSMQETNFDSDALFRSHQGSSHSLTVSSPSAGSPVDAYHVTHPSSPVTQRTRLLAGLEDRAVIVDVPHDNQVETNGCHCPKDPYSNAALYFLGYVTAVGGVGAIIMEICKAV